jgi:putative addiction module CopG family antidote
MDATKRLAIELPEELAEAVDARIASGRFANASEVVQEGLRLLAEEEEFETDPALEQWLRTEIVARYDAVKAGRDTGLTVDQVNANLAEARRRRNAAP